MKGGIMLIQDEKRTSNLSNGSFEKGSINQGILELVARFGYVSLEEVMYGFGLSEKESRNHLYYLVQLGLIQAFPSHTEPRNFYCLDKAGFSVVRSKDIVMDIDYFNKKTYRPLTQNHDRMLIRIHSALRKLLGSDLDSWITEKSIRKEESLIPIFKAHKKSRVLDGLFRIQMHKARFTQDGTGKLDFHDNTTGPWWTGLELELSMKSKDRYRMQFDVLSECVYDRVEKIQRIPQMLFLCGNPGLEKALLGFYQERPERYGRCVFVFGQVEAFLKNPKEAPLSRVLGRDRREILGKELNQMKLKVTL